MQKDEPALLDSPVQRFIGQKDGAAEKTCRTRNEARPRESQMHATANTEHFLRCGEAVGPLSAGHRAGFVEQRADCENTREHAREANRRTRNPDERQPLPVIGRRRSGEPRNSRGSVDFHRREFPQRQYEQHHECNRRNGATESAAPRRRA